MVREEDLSVDKNTPTVLAVMEKVRASSNDSAVVSTRAVSSASASSSSCEGEYNPATTETESKIPASAGTSTSWTRKPVDTDPEQQQVDHGSCQQPEENKNRPSALDSPSQDTEYHVIHSDNSDCASTNSTSENSAEVVQALLHNRSVIAQHQDWTTSRDQNGANRIPLSTRSAGESSVCSSSAATADGHREQGVFGSIVRGSQILFGRGIARVVTEIPRISIWEDNPNDRTMCVVFRWVPLVATFSLSLTLGIFLFTGYTLQHDLARTVFLIELSFFGMWVTLWVLSSAAGALICTVRMRRESTLDWTSKLEDFLGHHESLAEGMLHIVLLPYYREGEELLAETIQNMAFCSELAKEYIILVIACEERAGPADREQAQRLRQRCRHLFLDILINVHKEGELPDEVAGKSSNVQSAYLKVLRHLRKGGRFVNKNDIPQDMSESERKLAFSTPSYLQGNNMMNRYAPSNSFFGPPPPGTATIEQEGNESDRIAGLTSGLDQRPRIYDETKTFVTILDADTLLHRQYFPRLTYKGLVEQTFDQRQWSIYQAPQLEYRNIERVHGPIKAMSHGHPIYECGGIACSGWANHACHASYTITLALLKTVEGWDADVIAEDHHMFIKCLSASYWQNLIDNQQKGLTLSQSETRLIPLYTPALSYSVHDSDFVTAVGMKYTQARRHHQAVAEVSYLLVQWWHLCTHSRSGLPLRVHLQYLRLCLHMWTPLCMIGVFATFSAMFTVCNLLSIMSYTLGTQHRIYGKARKILDHFHEVPWFFLVCGVLLPTLACVAMSHVVSVVLRDVLEGRYAPLHLMDRPTMFDDQSDEEADEDEFTYDNDVTRQNKQLHFDAAATSSSSSTTASANTSGNEADNSSGTEQEVADASSTSSKQLQLSARYNKQPHEQQLQLQVGNTTTSLVQRRSSFGRPERQHLPPLRKEARPAKPDYGVVCCCPNRATYSRKYYAVLSYDSKGCLASEKEVGQMSNHHAYNNRANRLTDYIVYQMSDWETATHTNSSVEDSIEVDEQERHLLDHNFHIDEEMSTSSGNCTATEVEVFDPKCEAARLLQLQENHGTKIAPAPAAPGGDTGSSAGSSAPAVVPSNHHSLLNNSGASLSNTARSSCFGVETSQLQVVQRGGAEVLQQKGTGATSSSSLQLQEQGLVVQPRNSKSTSTVLKNTNAASFSAAPALTVSNLARLRSSTTQQQHDSNLVPRCEMVLHAREMDWFSSLWLWLEILVELGIWGLSNAIFYGMIPVHGALWCNAVQGNRAFKYVVAEKPGSNPQVVIAGGDDHISNMSRKNRPAEYYLSKRARSLNLSSSASRRHLDPTSGGGGLLYQPHHEQYGTLVSSRPSKHSIPGPSRKSWIVKQGTSGGPSSSSSTTTPGSSSAEEVDISSVASAQALASVEETPQAGSLRLLADAAARGAREPQELACQQHGSDVLQQVPI